ncbi:DUF2817 domain-containing protein [Hyphococcus flavus]|uniref:DUF2817 domain-containing protein n=1 Tax=Hyphococcus flavus TaxID=1866326 RepID=A0AAF0CEV4_9PROT|nr:DUF2817 domain-containing protein [Hyphococcus flavus]WDI30133.1 DUF2817 domain-containing protein [Hyphococcus flavus]
MSGHFSESVTDAHQKFVASAEAAGAEIELRRHPLKGPSGEDLCMAAARLGPASARRVLLVNSGTHGVEGYAGSALQIGYLDSFDASRLPADAAVLLVHLVNPWGAAWDRRENEDNIDVFRNFVYSTPPFPDNPEYRYLDDAINPSSWTDDTLRRADEKIKAYITAHGKDAFIALFRQGQHFNAKGLTYHGRGPCWSKQTFDSVAYKMIPNVQLGVCVDIHTGFGDFGDGLVIMYRSQGKERIEFSRHVYGEVYIAGDDALIPQHGSMPYDILSHAPFAQIHCVGLEFGTYDLMQEIDLFRRINFIFAYEDPLRREAELARGKMRELLYPASSEWRSSVLARGKEVLRNAELAVASWDGAA